MLEQKKPLWDRVVKILNSLHIQEEETKLGTAVIAVLKMCYYRACLFTLDTPTAATLMSLDSHMLRFVSICLH